MAEDRHVGGQDGPGVGSGPPGSRVRSSRQALIGARVPARRPRPTRRGARSMSTRIDRPVPQGGLGVVVGLVVRRRAPVLMAPGHTPLSAAGAPRADPVPTFLYHERRDPVSAMATRGDRRFAWSARRAHTGVCGAALVDDGSFLRNPCVAPILPKSSTGCARRRPQPGPFAPGRHVLCSVCARRTTTPGAGRRRGAEPPTDRPRGCSRASSSSGPSGPATSTPGASTSPTPTCSRPASTSASGSGPCASAAASCPGPTRSSGS